MTKQIIFIFALLCSLQVQANIHPSGRDSVRNISLYDDTELLRPVQPTYLDGVVISATRNGNWFVSIAGGTSAFLGTPLGCEDLFGRLKPSYNFALGKWFTPSVGARVNYQGLQFKDSELSTRDYHYVHADLLWNILGGKYARQEQVRWSLVPFAGIGLLHHSTNGHNPFAISYGVQGQYHISKRVSTIMELSGMTTFQDFDGYGKANRLGDHMLSLTAGFAFNIGKVGWKRAVDATPYIRQNEWLVDYANTLSEKNRRYAARHDKDRRILAELKKILEIEGLLDTYGYLVSDDDTDRQRGYPTNNYSGLNSLRARMKNRKWNGKTLLDQMKDSADNHTLASENQDSLVAKNWSLVYAGKECVGAPVYFFFNLNTATLTDTSQMLNLDELARVTKKYGLSVKVTGAADSATGTSDINNALSISRAEFIYKELERRGIPNERIIRTGRGGIADHVPVEANRHTKVELFFFEAAKTPK